MKADSFQTVTIDEGFRNDTIYLFRHPRGGYIRVVQLNMFENKHDFTRIASQLHDQVKSTLARKQKFKAEPVQQDDQQIEQVSTLTTIRGKQGCRLVQWLIQAQCDPCHQIDIFEPQPGVDPDEIYHQLRDSRVILDEPTKEATFGATTTASRNIAIGRLQLTIPKGYHDETVVRLAIEDAGNITLRVVSEKTLLSGDLLNSTEVEFPRTKSGNAGKFKVLPYGVDPVYHSRKDCGSYLVETMVLATNPQLVQQARSVEASLVKLR